MGKLLKKIKNIDKRHYIAIMITISFLLLSVFVYYNVGYRSVETIKDFGLSIAYYFQILVNGDSSIVPSVINKSNVDFKIALPETLSEAMNKVGIWWKALFTKNNFINYINWQSTFSLILVTIIEILIILIIIFKIFFKKMLKNSNNDYTEESTLLKCYKVIENKIIKVYQVIKNFFKFCFDNKIYKISWLLIWLYNLNIFTILGETLSYLIYIIASFDFSTFYIQFYKLYFDFAIMLKSLPIYVWIPVIFVLINIFRKNVAYKRLEHMEAKNTGFVHSLGAVTVFFGLCGGGKGMVMTDMTETMQKCFRNDTKETMQKFDLMFPNFPWIVFEKKLQNLLKTHKLYSLATIEQYINIRKQLFVNSVNMNLKESAKAILFDYDFEKYNYDFDNKMYIIDIFEALDTYAKAYYIYTLPEITLSNYAIRSDGILEDKGNFPLWDFDYFNRDSRDIDKISTYGKILDYDVLRKGKKVDENNPLADSLEIGLVVITEIDKDRGNQNDTKDLKSTVEQANQKNDRFNLSLKLDRHSSTIDFKYYLKFFFDLQRTMKTEADIRESGDNLGIGNKESGLLAMPWFFVEELIYHFMFDKFISTYETFRFYRADNNLFMYLLKKICGKFINYYQGIYNQFGYEVHHLKYIKDGNPDGIADEQTYYIMNAKAHAKRYMTDSFVDYFRSSALECTKGFIDYPSYKSVKATRQDMNKQHSYFIDDLEKNVVNHKEKNK